MGQVPNFPGVTMFIVRLSDDIGDVGDVLLRLESARNGQQPCPRGHRTYGGGPTDDSGAIATPAPDTPPPADQPLVPDTFQVRSVMPMRCVFLNKRRGDQPLLT